MTKNIREGKKMKNKTIYSAPQTLIYQTEETTAILSGSEMKLYKDEETNVNDMQYSRSGSSIWDDEE